jgi:hypothetical protein
MSARSAGVLVAPENAPIFRCLWIGDGVKTILIRMDRGCDSDSECSTDLFDAQRDFDEKKRLNDH